MPSDTRVRRPSPRLIYGATTQSQKHRASDCASAGEANVVLPAAACRCVRRPARPSLARLFPSSIKGKKMPRLFFPFSEPRFLPVDLMTDLMVRERPPLPTSRIQLPIVRDANSLGLRACQPAQLNGTAVRVLLAAAAVPLRLENVRSEKLDRARRIHGVKGSPARWWQRTGGTESRVRVEMVYKRGPVDECGWGLSEIRRASAAVGTGEATWTSNVVLCTGSLRTALPLSTAERLVEIGDRIALL